MRINIWTLLEKCWFKKKFEILDLCRMWIYLKKIRIGCMLPLGSNIFYLRSRKKKTCVTFPLQDDTVSRL